MDKIFYAIIFLKPVVQIFSTGGTAAEMPLWCDSSAKKPAEHRCSAGPFFVMLETFFTCQDNFIII
jgi:hypothetical protein